MAFTLGDKRSNADMGTFTVEDYPDLALRSQGHYVSCVKNRILKSQGRSRRSRWKAISEIQIKNDG